MYYFGICNNLIDFENFDYLNKSQVDANMGYWQATCTFAVRETTTTWSGFVEKTLWKISNTYPAITQLNSPPINLSPFAFLLKIPFNDNS